MRKSTTKKSSTKKRSTQTAKPTRKPVPITPVTDTYNNCRIFREEHKIKIIVHVHDDFELGIIGRIIDRGAYCQLISRTPPNLFCGVYAHNWLITPSLAKFDSIPNDAHRVFISRTLREDGMSVVTLTFEPNGSLPPVLKNTQPMAHAVVIFGINGTMEIALPTEWEMTSVPSEFPMMAYEVPGPKKNDTVDKLVDLVRQINTEFLGLNRGNAPDHDIKLRIGEDGCLELAVTTTKYLR